MNQKILQLLILLYLATCSSISSGATVPTTEMESPAAQYVEVSVDNLVINTVGLVSASNTLASSIDALAQALEKMASADATLTANEREALLSAVKSVDKASVAVSELAVRIPETAQRLTDQLPQVVKDAQAPIAELSSALEAASDGILAITQSLPQATENARELVNSTLNSVLLRVTIFAVILFVVFALVLILVVRYIYKSYIDPIARKLDALVGAPEHFANLAKHMKQTSDNLLLLQQAKPPLPPASESPSEI
jgi:preprotein translocase subunit SecG